jgi:hypothetical protein
MDESWGDLPPGLAECYTADVRRFERDCPPDSRRELRKITTEWRRDFFRAEVRIEIELYDKTTSRTVKPTWRTLHYDLHYDWSVSGSSIPRCLFTRS